MKDLLLNYKDLMFLLAIDNKKAKEYIHVIKSGYLQVGDNNTFNHKLIDSKVYVSIQQVKNIGDKYPFDKILLAIESLSVGLNVNTKLDIINNLSCIKAKKPTGMYSPITKFCPKEEVEMISNKLKEKKKELMKSHQVDWVDVELMNY